jgi:AraC family transcriptional regulator
VVDIALDYKFNNHETFSRAFKRLFGLQPIQWREQGVRPHGVLTPTMSYAYLEHIQQPEFQQPQRVTCSQRTLVGLMTPLTGRPERIARLWAEVRQVECSHRPERRERHYFGVTSYIDEEAFYLASYEVEAVDVVMPPLVCQMLVAGDYICMAHNAPMKALPLTMAYLYSTWLPKARLRPAYPVEVVDFEAAAPWEETPVKMVVWLAVERVGNCNRR